MFFPSSIQLEPIQIVVSLNPLRLFINLFMAPALSIYLYYRGLKRPLTPHLELLFHYCIATSFNYVFAKMLLLIPKRLFGIDFELDSAHYGLIALFSAGLLAQLFCLTQKIRIAIDVSVVTEDAEKLQIETKKSKEEFQNDETKQQ